MGCFAKKILLFLFVFLGHFCLDAQLDLSQIAKSHLGYESNNVAYNIIINDYQIPIKKLNDRKLRYFNNDDIEKVELVEKSKSQFDVGYNQNDQLILIYLNKKSWKQLSKRIKERIKRSNERIK